MMDSIFEAQKLARHALMMSSIPQAVWGALDDSGAEVNEIGYLDNAGNGDTINCKEPVELFEAAMLIAQNPFETAYIILSDGSAIWFKDDRYLRFEPSRQGERVATRKQTSATNRPDHSTTMSTLRMAPRNELAELVQVFRSIPTLLDDVASGIDRATGCWWIVLKFDLTDGLSWRVIQYFAHIANTLERRVEERPALFFRPESSPPGLVINERNHRNLHWRLGATSIEMTPAQATALFRQNLPQNCSERSAYSPLSF